MSPTDTSPPSSYLDLDERGVITTCPRCGTANRLTYQKIGQKARCQRCQTELALPAVPVDAPSERAFEALVAHAQLPVVADFWAAWCGPCKMMAPEFARVAVEGAGRWLAVKVDSDTLPELSTRYGVRALPTLVLFRAGREVARESGARPASAIRIFIERNL
jgi:thioredoxin 2